LTALSFEGVVLCGISPPFGRLSPARGNITHVLLTRAPLYQGRSPFSCDLHVLGAPLTFVLSQDQTLQLNLSSPRDARPKRGAQGPGSGFLKKKSHFGPNVGQTANGTSCSSGTHSSSSRGGLPFGELLRDALSSVRFSFQGPRGASAPSFKARGGESSRAPGSRQAPNLTAERCAASEPHDETEHGRRTPRLSTYCPQDRRSKPV
jgi:hypothetical protein